MTYCALLPCRIVSATGVDSRICTGRAAVTHGAAASSASPRPTALDNRRYGMVSALSTQGRNTGVICKGPVPGMKFARHVADARHVTRMDEHQRGGAGGQATGSS